MAGGLNVKGQVRNWGFVQGILSKTTVKRRYFYVLQHIYNILFKIIWWVKLKGVTLQ
jgi:hypothetical protein